MDGFLPISAPTTEALAICYALGVGYFLGRLHVKLAIWRAFGRRKTAAGEKIGQQSVSRDWAYNPATGIFEPPHREARAVADTIWSEPVTPADAVDPEKVVHLPIARPGHPGWPAPGWEKEFAESRARRAARDAAKPNRYDLDAMVDRGTASPFVDRMKAQAERMKARREFDEAIKERRVDHLDDKPRPGREQRNGE